MQKKIKDDMISIQATIEAFMEILEKLCNQGRWEEAKDYQRIIDRFMAFASAQPEAEPVIHCKNCKYRYYDEHHGWRCKLDTGDPYAEARDAEDGEWFCADAEKIESKMVREE